MCLLMAIHPASRRMRRARGWLRAALPLALIIMVISEMVGATNGVGFFIVKWVVRRFANRNAKLS